MMLFSSVMQIGLDNIPPVTLGLLVLNCVAFYNPPIPFLNFGEQRPLHPSLSLTAASTPAGHKEVVIS